MTTPRPPSARPRAPKPARAPATARAAPLRITRLAYEGPVYSPFSGKLAEREDEPNTRDRTLLLIFHGGAPAYSFISPRILAGRELEDVEERAPEALLRAARIPGMVILECDQGWNGVSTYAFAPA